MRKIILTLALAALPILALTSDEAEAPAPRITISAKGTDVREVISTIFEQAEKQFVLDTVGYRQLHLSVKDMEFDKALAIVCRLTDLAYEVRDGVYFIGRPAAKPAAKKEPTPAAPPKAESAAPAAPSTPAQTAPAAPAPARPRGPIGVLPTSVLQRRITTRHAKTDLRWVFGDLARQANVAIDLQNVPSFKIDAFFRNTSLKYALDEITKATGLEYRFTDQMSILVYRPRP
jgi:pyruvate/2-oxoglutarate dehydrogenase complex dihydrolipoamide acyltransferase (E2) component